MNTSFKHNRIVVVLILLSVFLFQLRFVTTNPEELDELSSLDIAFSGFFP